MSLFLLWGPSFMTGGGPKMVHFGPKLAKHSRLVKVPKWSKSVQKGPKWSTQVFLTIWEPFMNEFFALNGQDRVWRRCSGAKNDFFFNGQKESRWAQKGLKWSKTLGLTLLVHF